MRPCLMLRISMSVCFFMTIAGALNAQTDVALSAYGAFSKTASGNNVSQSQATQAGVLFELRHISNPLVGYEFAYSYNRANQQYAEKVTPPCPTGDVNCFVVGAASAAGSAHEITGDWVFSMKFANLRPFVLAGGGLMVNAASSAEMSGCYLMNPLCGRFPTPANSSTTGVFVYGAGLDWGLLPHLGLRLQYRGNVYKAPDLVNVVPSTNAFMHTAEPMVGAYFRF